MKEEKIRVLHIDDDVGARVISPSDQRFDATILPPEEVDIKHVESADIILVDWKIERWGALQETYDKLPVSCRPMDGLAVAACVRRYVKDSCIPVCLLTSQLDELAGPIPAFQRQAEVARNHDLDWVFLKQEAERLPDQLFALKECVERLAASWDGDILDTMALMGIKERNSTESLKRHVAESGPPETDLSEWSHGIYWLRWLLQRILSYPSYLNDEMWLAARLWIPAKSLNEAVRALFTECKYAGVLDNFCGTRWWKPLIEEKLWRETQGKSDQREAIHQWLVSEIGAVEQFDDDSIYVVARDPTTLAPHKSLPLTRTKKKFTDGWPPFGDPIYVEKEDQ